MPLEFSSVETLETVLSVLSKRFKTETRLSSQHLDLTPFFNPVRSQYNANEIIQRLLPLSGADDKIVGVTDLDLFIPVLSYIFGQAYLGGSVALVSGHRLENRRYGLASNDKLFTQRIIKCIVHELGHSFGLKHCLNPGCVMVSTTYVEEMDQKTDMFCQSCQKELLPHIT